MIWGHLSYKLQLCKSPLAVGAVREARHCWAPWSSQWSLPGQGFLPASRTPSWNLCFSFSEMEFFMAIKPYTVLMASASHSMIRLTSRRHGLTIIRYTWSIGLPKNKQWVESVEQIPYPIIGKKIISLSVGHDVMSKHPLAMFGVCVDFKRFGWLTDIGEF